ncbi:Uncharacterised protein [Candidatus Bilamarchaeum dharawalense]|uniref:Uncharacterized protein n=1 Tax=Candidatus Bilamarchaeum dharawalense TaxID=2885759 RepID=A0A5E4LNZ5_9ARCH|nr:Uncharacterised protein [Candidatus Bilamarchaeum dharawalense]
MNVERGKISNVTKYAHGILTKNPQTQLESKLFDYAIGTLVVIILLASVLYYFVLKQPGYVPLLALTVLSSVALVFSKEHMKHYESLTCMEGMMIGMTLGMMSGFMAGAIIGATNGMFYGSVFGLAIGIVFGFQMGRSSGVMGAMEGLMAGLMGGPMGAMSSVMMFNDHLMEFLFIIFGVCFVIIGGLSYMMNREAGSVTNEKHRTNFIEFLVTSLVLFLLLFGMSIYGPKGPVIYL